MARRVRLTQFVENPACTACKPGDRCFAGGEPGNPLYAIHGTHEPDRIGA